MGARHKSREIALQVLYQADVGETSIDSALRDQWASFAETPEGREFAEALARGVAQHQSDIDALIRAHSTHWRLERMPPVDRSILRLAIYELLQLPEVPPRVTINEAIELAKSFGAENSAAFVNGVLDRIAAQIRPA